MDKPDSSASRPPVEIRSNGWCTDKPGECFVCGIKIPSLPKYSTCVYSMAGSGEVFMTCSSCDLYLPAEIAMPYGFLFWDFSVEPEKPIPASLLLYPGEPESIRAKYFLQKLAE